ncbi:MAG: TVP38/TMEM64 family protein [Kiritimatiellae bacterium]|jgi:uncharacterized membrane protein YdjX (TVP38/TMEM64 family)|nr:TVP38/TMEM64 family protein [Kiritimatiellia bacterium]
MKRKLPLILLCVAAFVGAYLTLPVRETLELFTSYVEELGWPGMVLFVAAYAVAAVFLVPASVLTLGAGAAFGLVKGMIVVSLGSTLGAALAFLVGRHLARDKVRARFAGGEKFHAVDRAVAAEGWKIVALLRLSPVFPYVALNYLLGLTGVKFWPYVLASWVGMLPGTLLYVYAGYAARTAAQKPDTLQMVYNLIGLAVTLAVTVYVTRLARRAMKNVTPELDSTTEDSP